MKNYTKTHTFIIRDDSIFLKIKHTWINSLNKGGIVYITTYGIFKFLAKELWKKKEETNKRRITDLLPDTVADKTACNACHFLVNMNEKWCLKTLGQLSALFFYVNKLFRNYQILYINFPHQTIMHQGALKFSFTVTRENKPVWDDPHSLGSQSVSGCGICLIWRQGFGILKKNGDEIRVWKYAQESGITGLSEKFGRQDGIEKPSLINCPFLWHRCKRRAVCFVDGMERELCCKTDGTTQDRLTVWRYQTGEYLQLNLVAVRWWTGSEAFSRTES